MVLPIYKVISLVIRVFSKPLVSYIKQTHLKKDSNGSNVFIKRAFIYLGNAYNKGEGFINRKFMKIQSQYAHKPLNDQLAIEKGIQFFYEIIFYSLVIGLPLYEMNRASNQTKAKSKALDQKLSKIDEMLQKIAQNQKLTQIELQKPLSKAINQEPKISQESNLTLQTTNIKSQQPPKLPTIKLNLTNHQSHKYRIYFSQGTNYQNINLQNIP